MDALQLISRVAARYASVVLTPEYVEGILKGLDQGNAPDAFRRLQQLAKDLRTKNLDPFPVMELEAFLRGRGVPEDEVELVGRVKVRTPRTQREISFTDAFLQFGRETGTSVVPDMRFEGDTKVAKVVLNYLAAWKKLKPGARKVWAQAVKKVHLGRKRSHEDAAWLPGGVMHLVVETTVGVAGLTNIITHELGHAFEEIHNINPWSAPWGSAPFISDYAEMKPNIEDVAESFAAYFDKPNELRRKCPDKYTLIKSLV